jgi:hypothetical protein
MASKADCCQGTAKVLETERRRAGGDGDGAGREASLKYDKTGKILLVPQPSDDPNDPLVCASLHTIQLPVELTMR